MQALLEQDYVSGLFVNEKRVGKQPGALSMSDIGLIGTALTPLPTIVVNFRSFASDCQRTQILCAREIADTRLQGGQGMHGSFSRADTWNFMAARGPDFRQGFADSMPASNADIGMTIAHLLGVQPAATGKLSGRVLQESFREGGKSPDVCTQTLKSQPAANGLATILKTQRVNRDTRIQLLEQSRGQRVEFDRRAVRAFCDFGRLQTEEPADSGSRLQDARIRQVVNAQPDQALPDRLNNLGSGEECIEP